VSKGLKVLNLCLSNKKMEDTFRYILTLNEVKKAHPESSWVRITTVTMIAKFERDIDLPAFREKFKPLKIRAKDSSFEGFEWNLKKTTFYNQVTIFTRDQYSNKSIKLFPNGSVQVAGCSDLLDCRRIARLVDFVVNQTLASEIPNRLHLDTISVKMINTNFSLNSSVNLTKVINSFGVSIKDCASSWLRSEITKCFDRGDHAGVKKLEKKLFNLDYEADDSKFLVTFDPDRYSAVKVKFCPAPGMKRVTASIFSTGKIIVTGAQTLKEIALSYQIINRILAPASLRLGVSEKKDSFETILGHKFSAWVPKLQEKGVKAWT
jgi:TATA-box binding protein (TBP) (component of TFIID and TFIIIB)